MAGNLDNGLPTSKPRPDSGICPHFIDVVMDLDQGLSPYIVGYSRYVQRRSGVSLLIGHVSFLQLRFGVYIMTLYAKTSKYLQDLG
jgi:hypothetical protein